VDDTAFVIVVVTATFLLAGCVKGVVGMGLPIVAMGLLGALMAPLQAASLLVVPSLVTNLWQMLAGPELRVLSKRFATMMAAVCVGAFLGIGLLTGASTRLAAGALGAVLALYALIGLFAPQFHVRRQLEPWLSPIMGLVTGMLTGATGVFAIPAVPYFNSLNLGKEDLIQVLGISFTVSTVALALALAVNGQFQARAAWISLLAVVPALAGMYLGQHIRSRLQPEVFRRWFLLGLLALGTYMLLHAFATART
jgi:uncharacterized membrane protein YfcA